MTVYCFDIDGTLCTNTHGAFEQAEPYPDAIARVNALAEQGHEIVLYTARGSTTDKDWRELTERQLRAWGVRYDALHLGKPYADVYVDDRALSTKEWMDAGAVETVLGDPAYLDLTYDPQRLPYTAYPHQLAGWLAKQVYRRPGRLLDVGCGRGEYLAAFARLGFETAGLDVSPRAPQLAAGFAVKVADLDREPVPFAAGSFDFVFCKSVVEHTRRPVNLLARVREALRPGGIAVVMTPSWRHSYRGAFYIDHTHVTPFTAPSLADALALAGFEGPTVKHFRQLPFLWRQPALNPLISLLAALPLSYRPLDPGACWPQAVNTLIRFAKEVMLLAVARRPGSAGSSV
jgi:SAM-dependent methyltransferase